MTIIYSKRTLNCNWIAFSVKCCLIMQNKRFHLFINNYLWSLIIFARRWNNVIGLSTVNVIILVFTLNFLDYLLVLRLYCNNREERRGRWAIKKGSRGKEKAWRWSKEKENRKWCWNRWREWRGERIRW